MKMSHVKKILIECTVCLTGMVLLLSGKAPKTKSVNPGVYVKSVQYMGMDSLGNWGFSPTRTHENVLYLSPDSTFVYAKKYFIPRSYCSGQAESFYRGTWMVSGDSLYLYYNSAVFLDELLWRLGNIEDPTPDTILEAIELNDSNIIPFPDYWYRVEADLARMPKTISNRNDILELIDSAFYVYDLQSIEPNTK